MTTSRISAKAARISAPSRGAARHPAGLRSPLDSPTGKVPQQARSRERVAKILETCTELIRDGGLGRLNMSTIARVARIPIGSLYQYFPTKSALVHRLFQDRLLRLNQMTLARLNHVSSRDQCALAVRKLIHEIYVANREDPLMQEIWAGVQADRDIRYIHLQDNEFYTLFYTQLAERVGVRLPRKQLIDRVRVVNEMWDGVIRLAITRPKAEAVALLDECLSIGLEALGIESRER